MKNPGKNNISILVILILFLNSFSLNAQDIIVLNNNEKISAKVIVVGLTNITYKKFENLDGPSYEIAKDDVLKITYENGQDEFFLQNSETGLTSKKGIDPSINLAYKGSVDADYYYNKNWPLWTTFGGTIIFLPVGLAAGLISGIATPNIEVLIPDKDLLNSPEYYNAFMKRAQQKKWGKVGKGLILGIGVNVLFFILVTQ
ncbi:hypothetical protein JKA74_06420 [Marivirga sp. S37H4]|uniref:Uncharacterized protein n=1 Tax=Marivirga aurantiaca TaxID=2802615 RepID=A0A934WXK4_9BACT|nr:hypothetical protein [Marivirga aurantiaca]MBK6264665.1 hypothetical protein [Marivirga aurantiaca]